MAKSWKEWEKPLLDLEELISKMKEAAKSAPLEEQASADAKIAEFERRRDNIIGVLYERLGPWEKVLVARAEPRPYSLDYVGAIFRDFIELDGDRRYGADHAIIGGPAMLDDTSVMIIGQQKGRNINERQYRNFAMAKPEGYRKAIRLMEMADRFGMPIITLVDTPAADPGVESESRGISEAIAASILAMFELKVPVVSVIIGEGGSGGAIGIAAANRLLMLEHSVYSVIPPEGCAAILWRMPEKGPQASAALRLTAQSACEFGLCEEILPEPRGGAHRDWAQSAATVKEGILRHLNEIKMLDGETLKQQRYDRFRKFGLDQILQSNSASAI